MFGEDKLSRPERIRLESLSQALHLSGHVFVERPTEQKVLELAERIETWLKKSNEGMQ